MDKDIDEEYRSDIDDGKDMSLEDSMRFLRSEVDEFMLLMNYIGKDKLDGETDIAFHVVEDQEFAEVLVDMHIHYIVRLAENISIARKRINAENPLIAKFKRVICCDDQSHQEESQKAIDEEARHHE